MDNKRTTADGFHSNRLKHHSGISLYNLHKALSVIAVRPLAVCRWHIGADGATLQRMRVIVAHTCSSMAGRSSSLAQSVASFSVDGRQHSSVSLQLRSAVVFFRERKFCRNRHRKVSLQNCFASFFSGETL